MRSLNISSLVFYILAMASTSADDTNDYLISKWKRWYTGLDVNHDGIISFDDVIEGRKQFDVVHHLTSEEANVMEANLEGWWNNFIFRGKENITEEEFVISLSADYSQHKKKFRRKMKNCFASMFEIVDINGDKWISEEEFLIFFNTFGHPDGELDAHFNAFNPVNHRVSFRKMVNYWTFFVADEARPSVGETVENFLQGNTSYD